VLDSLKTHKKAVGVKQSLNCVEAGNAKAVYIAKDADDKVVAPLKDLCQRKAVTVIYVESMKALGKACSIDVGAAAAALLKE